MTGAKENTVAAHKIENMQDAQFANALANLLARAAAYKKSKAELDAALDTCIALAINIAVGKQACNALNKVAAAVFEYDPKGYAKTMLLVEEYLRDPKGIGLPENAILYIQPTNKLMCRPQVLADWLAANPDRIANAVKFSDWMKNHKAPKKIKPGQEVMQDAAKKLVNAIEKYHLDIDNSAIAEIKRIVAALYK